MTAALTAEPRPIIPPAGRPVPLPRLTLVELRKLADTRAGFWLLMVIGLATVGTSAVILGWAPEEEFTFADFFAFGLVPAAVLLPVLGILSMTSEWSQRTALTTFALVPARARVFTAKLAAGVLVAIASVAATAALSAAANLLGRALGGDGSWRVAGSLVGQSVLMQVVLVLMGMGFGALLLNSPVAIVAYLALPTVWTFLGQTIRPLRRTAEWLDVNLTSQPLSEPGMTAGQYGRLGVSVAVWVVLPLLMGLWRTLRREVS
jgi:ABC-2 type transport system permease protein